MALFERCLLLLYVLLRPNSSTHVATLYLGPMGSLWAYIEGMDAPYILFTGANGSDLAAWAGFGTFVLLERCLLLLYVLLPPNSSTQLYQCFHDPWGAFGHILKEWWTFPSPSQQPTAQIWRLGQIRLGTLTLIEACLLLLYVLCFPILLRSCMNVFMTHGEPLGIH